MSVYAVDGDTLTGIADAIRSKSGASDMMTVASMASSIEALPSGESDVLEEIGSYTLTESWENDTDGNPITIYNTLSAAFDFTVSKASDIYIAYVVNNSCAYKNYELNMMIFRYEAAFLCYIYRNNFTATRQGASSTSTWVSNGATIKVYKIKTEV